MSPYSTAYSRALAAILRMSPADRVALAEHLDEIATDARSVQLLADAMRRANELDGVQPERTEAP